jgi:hypothetical protein
MEDRRRQKNYVKGICWQCLLIVVAVAFALEAMINGF